MTNISRETVAIGADDMGRMIRKKIRSGPAPSMIAASSISLLSPSMNCRRKNSVNAWKSPPGRISPANEFSSPRSLIITKFGSSVKTVGTIRAVMRMLKTRLRPRQCSREKA